MVWGTQAKRLLGTNPHSCQGSHECTFQEERASLSQGSSCGLESKVKAEQAAFPRSRKGSLIFKEPSLLPPFPKSSFFLFPQLLRGPGVWERQWLPKFFTFSGRSAGKSCSQLVAIPPSLDSGRRGSCAVMELGFRGGPSGFSLFHLSSFTTILITIPKARGRSRPFCWTIPRQTGTGFPTSLIQK